MSDHYVLDASALLAVVRNEPGADQVHDILSKARISAVNFSEVIAKLQERGVPNSAIDTALGGLDLDIVPFDRQQADRAGKLRMPTRSAGLSFGDRACLALAEAEGAIALTADREWSNLDLPIQVEIIHR